MTKEELVKRRTEMVKLKTQMLANAQLCEGAIQDCDYWLQKLAAEPTPKSPLPAHVINALADEGMA